MIRTTPDNILIDCENVDQTMLRRQKKTVKFSPPVLTKIISLYAAMLDVWILFRFTWCVASLGKIISTIWCSA